MSGLAGSIDMARDETGGLNRRKRGKAQPGELRLTAREEDVLRLVVDGLGDAEIAQKLAISRRTVSWYVGELLERTGLPSRAALAVFAVKNNLLDML